MEHISQEHRTRLRYLLSSLEKRELEHQAHYGIIAVLQQLTTFSQATGVLKELLTGIEHCGRQALKQRLVLCETVLQRHEKHPGLFTLLPVLLKQMLSCIYHQSKQPNVGEQLAKLMEHLLGSVMRCHCSPATAGVVRVTAEWLTMEVMQPLQRATYREPENSCAHAASLVLAACLQVLQGYTHLALVAAAITEFFSSAVQLMATGNTIQRVGTCFLPVQRAVEVLGSQADATCTKRLLMLCLKAAQVPDNFQVRKEALTTLVVLASSLQFYQAASDGDQRGELVCTAALEVLVARKAAVIKALHELKYDKIPAVRAAAARALAEMAAIPGAQHGHDDDEQADAEEQRRAPRKPRPGDITAGAPGGTAGARPSSARKDSRTPRAARTPSSPLSKGSGRVGMSPGSRRCQVQPTFQRPPEPSLLDFGVQVFAPPPRSPSPARQQHVAAHAGRDQAGKSPSPSKRVELSLTAAGPHMDMRRSADASSQTDQSRMVLQQQTTAPQPYVMSAPSSPMHMMQQPPQQQPAASTINISGFISFGSSTGLSLPGGLPLQLHPKHPNLQQQHAAHLLPQQSSSPVCQQRQGFASAPSSPRPAPGLRLAPGVELLRHSWDSPGASRPGGAAAQAHSAAAAQPEHPQVLQGVHAFAGPSSMFLLQPSQQQRQEQLPSALGSKGSSPASNQAAVAAADSSRTGFNAAAAAAAAASALQQQGQQRPPHRPPADESSLASISTTAASLADGMAGPAAGGAARRRRAWEPAAPPAPAGDLAAQVARVLQQQGEHPAAVQRGSGGRRASGPGLSDMYMRLVSQARGMGLAGAELEPQAAAGGLTAGAPASEEEALLRRWQQVEAQAQAAFRPASLPSSCLASAAASAAPSARAPAPASQAASPRQLRVQLPSSATSAAASPRAAAVRLAQGLAGPGSTAATTPSSARSAAGPPGGGPGAAEGSAAAAAAEALAAQYCGKTPVMVKAFKTLQQAYAALSEERPASGASSHAAGSRPLRRPGSSSSRRPASEAAALAAARTEDAAARSLRSSLASEASTLAEVLAALSPSNPPPSAATLEALRAAAPLQQQDSGAVPLAGATAGHGAGAGADSGTPKGRLASEVAGIIATSAIISRQRSVAMEELGSVLERVRSIKHELEASVVVPQAGAEVSRSSGAPATAEDPAVPGSAKEQEAAAVAVQEQQEACEQQEAAAAMYALEPQQSEAQLLLQQLEQLATRSKAPAGPDEPKQQPLQAAMPELQPVRLQPGSPPHQATSEADGASKSNPRSPTGHMNEPRLLLPPVSEEQQQWEEEEQQQQQQQQWEEEQQEEEEQQQQKQKQQQQQAEMQGGDEDYQQLMQLSRKLEEIARRFGGCKDTGVGTSDDQLWSSATYAEAAHAPGSAVHPLVLPLLVQQQMNPLYESSEHSLWPGLTLPSTLAAGSAGVGTDSAVSWWCPSPCSDKTGAMPPHCDDSMPSSPVAATRLLD